MHERTYCLYGNRAVSCLSKHLWTYLVYFSASGHAVLCFNKHFVCTYVAKDTQNIQVGVSHLCCFAAARAIDELHQHKYNTFPNGFV